MAPAELAGGFGLPDARPLASRIEQTYLQRVEALPRDAQLLLLAAAAEPLGDLSLLWRAAERLGIGSEAVPAGRGRRACSSSAHGVRFPHPLVRSAVYRAADPSDRRDVHMALADATDPRRRSRPSRLASRARDGVAGRGGGGGAGALGRAARRAAAGWRRPPRSWQRAAELTPDPAVRVERSLAAAQAKLDVADFGVRVRPRWPPPSSGRLDELQRARLERLGAQIAFASRRGTTRRRCCSRRPGGWSRSTPKLARETYLEAIASAMFAGRLGTRPG